MRIRDLSVRGVHEVCDFYVDQYARLQPVVATESGIPGHDGQLPDLSPEGHQERADLASRAKTEMAAAQPRDDSERVAKAVFSERIGIEVEMHAAGLYAAYLSMMASPVQDIRQTFDLMSTATAEDWAVIATRLRRVPQAFAGYRASLLASADSGAMPASRQVWRVIEQCESWSGANGGRSFFATFAEAAEAMQGANDALRADLGAGVRAATAAYAELAAFLRDEIAPTATEEDAVGEERYLLWSRKFLGARVDPREAYAWGWDEFHRVQADLYQASGRIQPGAGPAEAAAVLDADSRYQVTGQAAFRSRMQEIADRALADLRGIHFDIPDHLMVLECRIAPPGGGLGAYYTNPSDDFSRPGRMWWALPPGQEEFFTWRDVSTVYHEGVPGHHLQIGTAVGSPGLNRFQRLLCFVDGHGEGWALYAERLMREFGYLDDGTLLGMLNKSLFRTARVIVDIGMHLKLRIPSGTGFHEGERWTPELGLEFLRTRLLIEPARVRDEIDRYLGWPGQASAYKLGERLWLSLRDEVKAQRGKDFDLKEFHMRALRGGPAGLDTMRELLPML